MTALLLLYLSFLPLNIIRDLLCKIHVAFFPRVMYRFGQANLVRPFYYGPENNSNPAISVPEHGKTTIPACSKKSCRSDTVGSLWICVNGFPGKILFFFGSVISLFGAGGKTCVFPHRPFKIQIRGKCGVFSQKGLVQRLGKHEVKKGEKGWLTPNWREHCAG